MSERREQSCLFVSEGSPFFAVPVDWNDLDGCFTAVFAIKCVHVQVCACASMCVCIVSFFHHIKTAGKLYILLNTSSHSQIHQSAISAHTYLLHSHILN